MAIKKKPLLPNSSSCCFVVFIFSILLFSSTALAKSRRPITEAETRQKKNECYADIESGLWGWQCKSSVIAKENCALRCLSTPCYDLIYAGDPLEEGEKDLIRSQEFKYCMHKLSLGESLEGVKGSFEY
ncbi:Protein OS-9 [Fagus crenata]